jgi:hypothetical protein
MVCTGPLCDAAPVTVRVTGLVEALTTAGSAKGDDNTETAAS